MWISFFQLEENNPKRKMGLQSVRYSYRLSFFIMFLQYIIYLNVFKRTPHREQEQSVRTGDSRSKLAININQ